MTLRSGEQDKVKIFDKNFVILAKLSEKVEYRNGLSWPPSLKPRETGGVSPGRSRNLPPPPTSEELATHRWRVGEVFPLI